MGLFSSPYSIVVICLAISVSEAFTPYWSVFQKSFSFSGFNKVPHLRSKEDGSKSVSDQQLIKDKLEDFTKSSLYKSDAAKFGIDTVLAVGLLEEGLYEEAAERAKKAMELGEHTGEPDNVYTAYAEGILGDILYKSGSVEEAADHYRSALRIYERHYRSSSGPEAIQMLGASQMISWKLLGDRKYKEAIDACSTALGLAETLLGPTSPDVATCLFNLGTAYLNCGDTGTRTEAIFKQAISIYKDCESPPYTNIGNALGSLGNLYFERADFDAAQETFNEVKILHEEGLCTGRPVAPTLKNLGGIYWRLGRLDEAEEMYGRALSILEEEEDYGPHHELCEEIRMIIGSIRDEKIEKEM
mmetsp:Transcript_19674/g.19769  ORF Transcript_19674/g.19769 Transcript_19674/m.19769 type:complete len:358 (+) Transcript_19674:71-1144(+)|eukprot:CAMPEP_0182419312 /NCGR_PEP_ID=MMETSP1167-20130531/3772_1 /TAXON_ID=2988 /ORGANISM="Mallomonas Sp, Strain CCMP3275" /LENGTH=357 /DNA_ID=CAMNT_0024594151 /DNA_START=69 /DNA_END=1142 /DNA_ORIENTATION=-